MTDGIVAIQQSATPDRNIDNAVLTNDDGDTVYRQRVEDPELMALVRQMVESMNRLGAGFDASGRLFVRLTDAAGTAQAVSAAQSGTWNVGTVTTVTGITNLGGYPANAGIPSLMQVPVSTLRAQIVVT